MSRSEIFQDTTSSKDGRMPRNLRLQAHEFADWSHGREPEHHTDHAITNQKYGRSSGSNN